jgi:hypothetical protein
MGIRVGSVDKFPGQEAAVVLSFLFEKNRTLHEMMLASLLCAFGKPAASLRSRALIYE